MSGNTCETCTNFSRLTGHCSVYEASVVAEFERAWGSVCGKEGRRWAPRTIHRDLRFLYVFLAVVAVLGVPVGLAWALG